MRILVVEEEKKTASFIRKAVQEEGFAVDISRDPVRISDSFARNRDFTLHSSHELKTPLTVLPASATTRALGRASEAQW